MEDNGLIGLKDACAELSISVATGKNWLKLGKMLPSLVEGKTAYFTRAYLDQLKLELQSGQNRALKSRRNKNMFLVTRCIKHMFQRNLLMLHMCKNY